MTPELRGLFQPDPGYLNTASLGVPPIAAVTEVLDVLERWRCGRLSPPDFDEHVARSRTAWAALTGIPRTQVAVGGTVSEFVGVVAASLPDGAQVVVAQGEFTSVSFPFLAHADRGVRVRELPLEQLVSFDGPADLIAVSAVQSANGRQVDVTALGAAAHAAGARLLLDTTQSCGWLPLDVSAADYVVCAAYKWLLCPRGTGFLSVRPDALEQLRPLAAGWYAGEDPWTSIYGAPLRLARDARRLDLSPAWFSWVGAAVSLELLAGLDLEQVHAHDVRLADALLARLGLPAQGSAIVTLDAGSAAEQRLAAAGVRTAVRAGRVRASFHLYNDDADVELAGAALGGEL
ncbi:MAG: aminotransferase class V-fold PLP-dependent enzyme [Actinobacteria bacterium]|nr:aminotransferase class V-fold PLP-dependent enzyme [Actinomycetota bacterium]